MPYSTTSIFGEWDNFQAALHNESNLNQFVTAQGRFRARLTQVELDRLRLSSVEEHLPRIGFLEVPATKILVSFPIGDQPALVWGGIGPRKGEFMTFGPGHRGHMRTQGPCRWGAIWFPAQELADYFRALTQCTLAIPPVAQRWRPPPAARRCSATPCGRHSCRRSSAGQHRERRGSAWDGAAIDRSRGRVPVGRTGGRGNTSQASASGSYGPVRGSAPDTAGPASARGRTQCGDWRFAAAPAHVLQGDPGHEPDQLRPASRTVPGAPYFAQRGPGATSVSQVARNHGFRALGRFAATYRSCSVSCRPYRVEADLPARQAASVARKLARS